MREYETVIGLEVHVELATKTKLFCGCSTSFGAKPNTHTCPVCAGMPGALPVLNRQVVEHAVAVGLALGCEITRYSRFDRKNYFYPDNPQNYQISQLYLPICRNGKVRIETESGIKEIGVHELHMEEDAGKLVHEEGAEDSLVDFNRAGVPLIEIVSEPDMGSADEVIAYLDKLRTTIRYLGASDCKLQEGSMRVDVNLSVKEAGTRRLGTRTEMKNLSSFKAISRAIAHERARQIALLESGGRVEQETRRWDDNRQTSFASRSKEDAKDYRYFPEPDLMPVVINDEWLQKLRDRLPELREEKLARFKSEYGLPDYDAAILTDDKKLAELFEATAKICKKPKKVSNWLMGETMRLLNEEGKEPEDLDFTPVNLAKLIHLADSGRINSTVAKEVFEEIYHRDVDPEVYVKEHGCTILDDEDMLRRVVMQVLSENPKSVEDYRGGKKKAIGFLVGQTMKATEGKADPGRVNELLSKLLAGNHCSDEG